MIIDLRKFLRDEAPFWKELETLLDELRDSRAGQWPVERLQRCHYLYQRASADLAKVTTFAAEPGVRHYLEALVARAYGEIHEARPHENPLRTVIAGAAAFPRAFQRHRLALLISLAVTVGGALFGAGAVALDPGAKRVIMPFPHLLQSPERRVAREEQQAADALQGVQGRFAGQLMTHNTRIAVMTMALGILWGVFTIVILFYNGVILGAVAADFVLAGHTPFLLGWLLPHGVVEIPAIVVAGQAGLVLAGVVLDRGSRFSLTERFGAVRDDTVILIAGVAVMLAWAGIVEAFFSQYHAPTLPYAVKIGFGLAELLGLALLLGWPRPATTPSPDPETVP